MAMARGQVLVFLLRTSSANNNTMETAYIMDIFCFPFIKRTLMVFKITKPHKNMPMQRPVLPRSAPLFQKLVWHTAMQKILQLAHISDCTS